MLDPEQWRTLSAYLDEALDLPEDERAAWLEALHRRDPALAAEVRGLLDEHQELSREQFLASGPGRCRARRRWKASRSAPTRSSHRSARGAWEASGWRGAATAGSSARWRSSS